MTEWVERRSTPRIAALQWNGSNRIEMQKHLDIHCYLVTEGFEAWIDVVSDGTFVRRRLNVGDWVVNREVYTNQDFRNTFRFSFDSLPNSL